MVTESLRVVGPITAFMYAIVYGIYLATFAHCLRWLTFEGKGWETRQSHNIHWGMLTTAILLLILSTTSLGAMLQIATTPVMGGDLSVLKKCSILKVRTYQRLTSITLIPPCEQIGADNMTILVTDAVLVRILQ